MFGGAGSGSDLQDTWEWNGGIPAMWTDQTVVAVHDDGVLFTMGDFKTLYAALPPAVLR